jgi:5-hydroxyisourate hydrolase-like protein (transthyretin family)
MDESARFFQRASTIHAQATDLALRLKTLNLMEEAVTKGDYPNAFRSAAYFQ